MALVNALIRICEEAVAAQFTVLSRHFPMVTEENHEKLVIICIPVETCKGHAVNTKQKHYRSSHRARCHRTVG